MRYDTTFIARHPRVAALATAAGCLVFQLVATLSPAMAATTTVDVSVDKKVYQPHTPVKGEVTVTGDKHLKALLRVFTFNEQSGNEIDLREYPVTLPADGSRTIPFVIAPTPAPDASYSVVAALYIDKDNIPEVQNKARFGVRPPGFPEGVPDHILKAEVDSLNVPEILEDLEWGAQEKSPVGLSIGSQKFTVQVERQELLAPGVEIPGLGRPPTFVGKIVNSKGEMEEESLVVFTVTNGQLGGALHMPVDTTNEPPGQIPPGATESLWIQPLSDMQLHSGVETKAASAAAPGLHICYRQKDTIPPPEVGPEGHGDPIVEVPPQAFLPEPEAMAFEALLAPPTLTHEVNIQVYQDNDTAAFSGFHYNIIFAWAQQLKKNFGLAGTGIPRYTGASIVKVSGVTISKWQQISRAGYSTDCNANLAKFQDDTEAGRNGPIKNNTLQILLTTQSMDCGGIAYLGRPVAAGSGKRMYSLTKDTSGSASYDTMVLLQETGHNLDWHASWTPRPHDSHLAPEISESYTHFHFFSLVGPFIGDSKHCTAMMGSYGDCQEPEPVWAWGLGSSSLTHLAEGIAQLFPGTP